MWNPLSKEKDGSHAFGINHDKRTRLREMNVFVLDNSLRESTVAQRAGHTLNNKIEILNEIKKCSFDNILVGAFGGLLEVDKRVDDAFCENLGHHIKNAGMDMKDTWTYAFTEISDKMPVADDGSMAMLYGDNYVPAGLQKMKKYGISSAVIEIDVHYTRTVPMEQVMDCLAFDLAWANDNLQSLERPNHHGRNMVNL
jgi:hypothetical protein